MGFSDLDKHFHLSGLGLVSAEGVDEYQFMLESLIHGITQVTNEQLKPNAVVGDSTARFLKQSRTRSMAAFRVSIVGHT